MCLQERKGRMAGGFDEAKDRVLGEHGAKEQKYVPDLRH
jgi:hypothetical protein